MSPSLGPLSSLVVCLELSRRAMLLEAIPAVYRPALGGLERYLAFVAAVRALGLVHLPGATKAPASVPVSVSHFLTLYFFLTSPSRIMFAQCDPVGAAMSEPSSRMLCRPPYFVPRIYVLTYCNPRRGPCSTGP